MLENISTAGISFDSWELRHAMRENPGHALGAGQLPSASQHAKTTMESLQSRTFSTTQPSNKVNSLLNTLGGIKVGEHVGATHTAAWYDMQMTRMQNAESFESSAQILDQLKKLLERKAQETASGQYETSTEDAAGGDAQFTAPASTDSNGVGDTSGNRESTTVGSTKTKARSLDLMV